jgi:hypothetical protein
MVGYQVLVRSGSTDFYSGTGKLGRKMRVNLWCHCDYVLAGLS